MAPSDTFNIMKTHTIYSCCHTKVDPSELYILINILYTYDIIRWLMYFNNIDCINCKKMYYVSSQNIDTSFCFYATICKFP